MAYSSDLTDAQWNMLELLLVVPSKRGPKHEDDLRHVVDAMLYISHTGCQWRYLPEQFGPWTRVWFQFRRWSRNETWTHVLAALHASSRTNLGRNEPLPPMVVIDAHLAKGASSGGATFHNQGGPSGRTNGAKRIVCVDVTGLPLCVRVVPASTSAARAVELILEDLGEAQFEVTRKYFGFYEGPLGASSPCVHLMVRKECKFQMAPFGDGCLITGRVVRYDSTLDSY